MSDIVVETAAGKVRGVTTERGTHVFKGIPYCAPPVGPLRFRPPVPRAPWSGVLDAFDYGAPAPAPQAATGQVPPGLAGRLYEQQRPGDIPQPPMSEDCLVLNVWSGGLDTAQRRPVMFFIHGGAFMGGSGAEQDAERLADRGDVVVVSMNHRLGILGYLYLAEIGGDDYADSGNVGMLDLVLCLEWVRDNIAAFGGDPDNVTIWGCSGGSSKTLTLMGMPPAEGLFHRANPIDGPLRRVAEPTAASEVAERVLHDLGLSAKSLPELHDIPWERLLDVQAGRSQALTSTLAGGASDGVGVMQFLPVVDGRSVPAHPFDPVASPLSADVPTMLGSARDSMTIVMLGAPWFGTLDEAGLRAFAALNLGEGADGVLAAYRRARPAATPTQVACSIVSDRVMWAKTIALAELKAAGGTAPVFLYRWDYPSPALDGLMGACHSGELAYILRNCGRSPAAGHAPAGAGALLGGDRPEDLARQELMSETWVRFATDGDPNHDALPKWAPYWVEDRTTMVFGTETRAVADPDGEIREAYEQVPAEYFIN